MKRLLARLLGRRAPRTDPVPAPRRRPPDARPDPQAYRGRPIGDYLKALGSEEDTSRYGRGRGITTVVLLRRRPARPGEGDAPERRPWRDAGGR